MTPVLARGLVAGAFLVFAVVGRVSADQPYCGQDQSPTFGPAFATLVEQLGDIVGEPLDCEHADESSQLVVQATTTGNLFRDPSDGSVGFSNGVDRWIVGPDGAVVWPSDSNFGQVRQRGGVPAVQDRLGSDLAQLLAAPDPPTFAALHGLQLDDRGVRVVVTLASGGQADDVAQAYGIIRDAQFGSALEGMVPLPQLRALAEDARVQMVRAPARLAY
jgi:hypothetical protein